MEKKLICRVLTGPTASGKSDIAFRIARENGWEIICMDSMQIYRGMDIGTAKPTKEEQRAVPHHMLDICDPRDPYSVSMYTEAAEHTVREIAESGRQALFVGGTGLYLEGMARGMSMGNAPADESLRARLRILAETPEGRRMLEERLREADPETADRLPQNDIRRRIRAIEVYETTGIPFSKQPGRKEGSSFRWIIISTCMEGEHLYRRINRRVDRMLQAGLADEVEKLLEAGVPDDAQSMQAIGYKEMIPYLRGECSTEKAADEIRKRTRHYAKRQMTFLKRIDNVIYMDSESENAYEKIREIFMKDGDGRV